MFSFVCLCVCVLFVFVCSCVCLFVWFVCFLFVCLITVFVCVRVLFCVFVCFVCLCLFACLFCLIVRLLFVSLFICLFCFCVFLFLCVCFCLCVVVVRCLFARPGLVFVCCLRVCDLFVACSSPGQALFLCVVYVFVLSCCYCLRCVFLRLDRPCFACFCLVAFLIIHYLIVACSSPGQALFLRVV